MTCTSCHLLDNIKWRLEALSVHTDPDTTLKGFVYYDRDQLGPDLSSGMTRGFTLEFTDGSSEDNAQGSVQTQTMQQWGLSLLIRVAYHKNSNWLAIQRLMQRDRFDIVKLLRNQTYWDGIPEDPSLELNANARQCARWRISETANALYLDLYWDINALEDE